MKTIFLFTVISITIIGCGSSGPSSIYLNNACEVIYDDAGYYWGNQPKSFFFSFNRLGNYKVEFISLYPNQNGQEELPENFTINVTKYTEGRNSAQYFIPRRAWYYDLNCSIKVTLNTRDSMLVEVNNFISK